MIRLENRFLIIQIDEALGNFGFRSADIPNLFAKTGQFGLQIWQAGRRKEIRAEQLNLIDLETGLTETTHNGPLTKLRLRYSIRDPHTELALEFGLLDGYPFLLQKMRLENLGSEPIELGQFIFGDFQKGQIHLEYTTPARYSVFANGWQSWSPSGAWQAHERQPRTKLGPLADPMITNPGTPLTRRAGHFSADMFAVLSDLQSSQALLVGFLAQKEQFGSIEIDLNGQPSLKVWANGDRALLHPGQTTQSDWLSYSFTDLESPLPTREYLMAVNRENLVKLPGRPPVGWCSWYYYFTKISDGIIRENLNQVNEMREDLPLQLLQIDDGFEADVGDWLNFNRRFPTGVQDLAAEIKASDLEAGIWLAPYILEAGSSMIKKHPGWLLRKRNGRLANAGFGWGGRLCRALDLTNPEALVYTREVIRTAVHDWGFTYLKLDFLYAAVVDCQYQDPTQTRAQVLRRGLESIRKTAGPDVKLLGCGLPIGPALGLMDLMRISADVAPDWHPRFFPVSPILRQEPNMPSVRNALQNILARADLDQHWFGNDPDCLMVRPDSNLSLPEVQTLASVIGITGGAMLLSDRLTTLPKERLRLAQQFIPVIPGNPRVLDKFETQYASKIRHDLGDAQGAYTLACLINWAEKPRDLGFDLDEFKMDSSQNWIGREVWTGQWITSQEKIVFDKVPVHGCRLLTLRPLTGENQYLGSDLHFSQGMELKKWQDDGDCLQFELDLGHRMQGEIYLWLKQPPLAVTGNGQPLQPRLISPNIYAIRVALETSLLIHIQA